MQKSRSYENNLGVNVQVECRKSDLSFHDELPRSSDSGGGDSIPELLDQKLECKTEPGLKSLNIADLPLMMKVHEEALSPPAFNLMEKIINKREKSSTSIPHMENISTSELESTISTSSISSSSKSNSIDFGNLSSDHVQKRGTEHHESQNLQK